MVSTLTIRILPGKREPTKDIMDCCGDLSPKESLSPVTARRISCLSVTGPTTFLEESWDIRHRKKSLSGHWIKSMTCKSRRVLAAIRSGLRPFLRTAKTNYYELICCYCNLLLQFAFFISSINLLKILEKPRGVAS